MQKLKQFRQDVDEFLKHHPQSPLEHEQRRKFEGLNYYPPNADLVIEADVERLPDDEPIVEMQTSTGSTQQYRRWGQFAFTVEGEEATLTLYSDPQGRDFFLPFKDTTNGEETYGAGRYMDDHRPAIVRLEDDRFRFDFNFAYNPYCAYSAMYSCPLPPRENWLQVPIRAGEKAFESDHAY